MAKLILKYDQRALKEVAIEKDSLTVGRSPGADVVIDNLAVSGKHARIAFEDGQFLVEDLSSMNGTFLNGQRIRRSPLKENDEIAIGKHTLTFFREAEKPMVVEAKASEPVVNADMTMMLDTQKRREFLAKATVIAEEGVSPAAQAKVGCLTVLSGKTDHMEYILTSKLSVIGKSEMASVKLRGWFAPKVAAVINRKDSVYTIAPSQKTGAAKVNSQILEASHSLKEGDLIQIGKVRLQFFFRE